MGFNSAFKGLKHSRYYTRLKLIQFFPHIYMCIIHMISGENNDYSLVYP